MDVIPNNLLILYLSKRALTRAKIVSHYIQKYFVTHRINIGFYLGKKMFAFPNDHHGYCLI